MYNNRDNLVVGLDYYNLKTGEYLFTHLYDDCSDERLEVEGIPVETPSKWSGDYTDTTYAYNKETMKTLTEDDLCDICYENLVVDKVRLDEINVTKQVLLNLIEGSGIREPFVVEDGKVSVGREQVLSAHIQAGYEHGWIQSSICW